MGKRMGVKLLDCTLRDGGHINESNFGKSTIKEIIADLVDTKIEIIEVGFLRNCIYNPDKAVFPNIEAVKHLLKKDEQVQYALMIQEDQYDCDLLEENDGSVEYIRVSFHNYDFEEGLECCRKVISKGYKCFVNPINLPGYTDLEIIHIINKVNEIQPFAFTIVDTFGTIQKKDLVRIYQMLENNLKKEIEIGLHLHENLSLAYSLAQYFVEMRQPTRNIVIDGSLYGMGRIPGNLCIELMMEYMNSCVGSDYRTEAAYDAIDDFIVPIKKRIPWGYSTAYALSAKYSLHRSYAEYLLGKGRLRTKDIQRILASVDEKERTIYNQTYIEKIYLNYIDIKIDDSKIIKSLETLLDKSRPILIISPGKSIIKYQEEIREFTQRHNPYIIMVNFYDKIYNPDSVFFTNIKRYKQSFFNGIQSKVIISSNLVNQEIISDYAVNYHDLIRFGGTISENSTLMLLNLLNRLEVRDIYCAGFDGFGEEGNFYTESYERKIDYAKENADVAGILKDELKQMKIYSITPSLYFERK